MAILRRQKLLCFSSWSCCGFLFIACSSNSSSEAVTGTYSLVSATLRSASRVQLIECAGDFKLALKIEQSDSASQSFMRVQPKGAALCRSRNPATFEENLGGDCTLNEILFLRKNEGTGYRLGQNLGQSWQCNPKGVDNPQPSGSPAKSLSFDSTSQMNIQAFSADTIVLNHSSQSIEYSTEFVFKRSAE
jgi:hypothetical protein